MTCTTINLIKMFSRISLPNNICQNNFQRIFYHSRFSLTRFFLSSQDQSNLSRRCYTQLSRNSSILPTKPISYNKVSNIPQCFSTIELSCQITSRYWYSIFNKKPYFLREDANTRFISNKSKEPSGGNQVSENKTTQMSNKKKKTHRKKRLPSDLEVVASGAVNQHHFLTFDPGLELPLPTTPKKQRRDYEVVAYATADEYNLEDLLQGFKELGLYERSSHHLLGGYNEEQHKKEIMSGVQGFSKAQPHQTPQQHADEDDVIPGLSEVLHVIGLYKVSVEDREIYFFQDGTVVFWNVNELERRNVLKYVRRFSLGDCVVTAALEEQSESLPYTYTEGKTRLSGGDRIMLGLNRDTHLERYTFSNALANSVKLGMFEVDLDEYIDKIEIVAKELAKTGHIVLSKPEVLKRLGQLFELRHSLSLSSDLLDTPDFYWDRHQLESLYQQTCRSLSIAKRTEVMRTKLNDCVELLQLLKGHHGEEQGHGLERIIIYLICVEVVFEVLHFVI